MKASGYPLAASPLIIVTGGLALLFSPFGVFSICIAAITAAICQSPDAHPDAEKRWLAAIAAGGFYLLAGIFGGSITGLMAALPLSWIQTLAGLALLGAVTPIFGKSDSFPQGVDQSVFDGIRDGLRKDRAQFISDFATPFYGTNAGQTVSAGALTQTLNIALLASLKGTIDCVTAFGETDFRPDMAKIDVPTLVIHGSNDQIVPFESTGKLAAEMIKNATLKVYDNAPHGFALTHQDQLNEDLLAFVKSL